MISKSSPVIWRTRKLSGSMLTDNCSRGGSATEQAASSMPDRMAGRHLSIAFDFRICIIIFRTPDIFPKSTQTFEDRALPVPFSCALRSI